ncbi:furin-like protease kpc-1 isoform X2 [Mizuhopecten yessoensis]|uniref:furin-like protease kpc-1 isoform X2 n=1 Tax=Mizuhopecten yessoensis TaxID=6573 RepID=UPI000B45844A|nr:furin-like protease kpc-1 isoform X2 [Mizuhopecten yessoensis]
MHGYRYIIHLSIFGLIFIEITRGEHYTDKWAVHIEGGVREARSLADKHNFVYLGQIMPDYYHFQHRKVAKRSLYSSSYFHRTLASEPNVRWLEQQVAKKRKKRSLYFPHQSFNDPKWPRMWYLHRGEGLDMNVQSAWDQGVTGKGVVVTILDDGIEKDHPDLARNYDERASYDVNSHDPDPQPRYDYTNENRHGTRCAGEVAAHANNNICSVGVAYEASIGGVRMLDGDVTDSVEAQSLSLNPDHIHVYSASWGPDDDGRTVDGPATLARKAFHDGINLGRGGLGSIFVWASGNGGRDFDSCNCDGYTNSIHTISISSATENGNIPWYSEACSSTLATTYSSGSSGEKQIVTTDLRKTCTESHTGTSASAPLAAGICALALQANPSLTWRDLQHIVVMTAKRGNLRADDWTYNGVNRSVSHSFGFGLMDAGAMVRLAKNWTTVPPQNICEIRLQERNRPVPANSKISVPLHTDGCIRTVNQVKYLEHVQARITLCAIRRGEISIYLRSPMGTRSTLLARRQRDVSRDGFNNWAFMTTHNWGEYAKGTWTLEIENGGSAMRAAKLDDWVLVLYGTETDPLRTTITTSTTTKITPLKNNSRPRKTELKQWTLVVMGTGTHPQSRNITSQPVKKKEPLKCAGITSHGICIECRPGFYKFGDGCVASCPEFYYGTMETVLMDSNHNSSGWAPQYQRHGICHACNDACRTCKGPYVEDCFQCSEGYEIRDGYCRRKLIMNFLDPDMLSFFVWVIILCTSAILLFGVVFIVLQARDHNILCWRGEKERQSEGSKGKYRDVPTRPAEDRESDIDHYHTVLQNIHTLNSYNKYSLNHSYPPTRH